MNTLSIATTTSVIRIVYRNVAFTFTKPGRYWILTAGSEGFNEIIDFKGYSTVHGAYDHHWALVEVESTGTFTLLNQDKWKYGYDSSMKDTYMNILMNLFNVQLATGKASWLQLEHEAHRKVFGTLTYAMLEKCWRDDLRNAWYSYMSFLNRMKTVYRQHFDGRFFEKWNDVKEHVLTTIGGNAEAQQKIMYKLSMLDLGAFYTEVGNVKFHKCRADFFADFTMEDLQYMDIAPFEAKVEKARQEYLTYDAAVKGAFDQLMAFRAEDDKLRKKSK